MMFPIFDVSFSFSMHLWAALADEKTTYKDRTTITRNRDIEKSDSPPLLHPTELKLNDGSTPGGGGRQLLNS